MSRCRVCRDEGCPACRWGQGTYHAHEAALIERLRRLRSSLGDQRSAIDYGASWPDGSAQPRTLASPN